MLIPVAGFVAGMTHVMTGPDHLAAVAPLAVTDRRAAWRGGLAWALGHAGGVCIVAVFALAIREGLPLHADWLSGWSERIVGVVLIGIGLWGIRRAFSTRLHTHVHEHDGHRHRHVHVHPRTSAHDLKAEGGHHHSHAAMAVGTLHGVAGGSHFLGVIPALTLGPSDAIIYLMAYGLGTIAAMVFFASVLGLLATSAGASGTAWTRGLMTLSSLVAVGVGMSWLLADHSAAA